MVLGAAQGAPPPSRVSAGPYTLVPQGLRLLEGRWDKDTVAPRREKGYLQTVWLSGGWRPAGS